MTKNIFFVWNQTRIFEAVHEIQKPHITFLKNRDEFAYDYIALKHTILWSIFAAPFLIGIFGFVYKGYADGLRNELVDSIQTIISGIILQFMFATFLVFGDKFRTLLDRMDQMTTKVPEKIAKMYIIVNNATWILYYIIMAFMVVLGLSNYLFNKHCEGREKTGGKGYICGQHHYIWYPLEIEDSSLKILLTLYVNLLLSLLIPLYIASSIGFLQIPLILSLRIQDLRHQLENIDENNYDSRENVVPLIEYYSEILGCVKDMNECVGYTFIAQTIFTTLLMASLVYLTIIGDMWANLFTLLACLFYMYIFCRVGQFLEDEHEKLVECVKSLPWYNMSPMMRQNYRLFLGNVQIPIHFEIYPLLKVNKKYLLFLLRGSYSMATFMMNLTNIK